MYISGLPIFSPPFRLGLLDFNSALLLLLFPLLSLQIRKNRTEKSRLEKTEQERTDQKEQLRTEQIRKDRSGKNRSDKTDQEKTDQKRQIRKEQIRKDRSARPGIPASWTPSIPRGPTSYTRQLDSQYPSRPDQLYLPARRQVC